MLPIGQQLPVCWRTLYELTKLTDEQFDTNNEKGRHQVTHGNVKRSERQVACPEYAAAAQQIGNTTMIRAARPADAFVCLTIGASIRPDFRGRGHARQGRPTNVRGKGSRGHTVASDMGWGRSKMSHLRKPTLDYQRSYCPAGYIGSWQQRNARWRRISANYDDLGRVRVHPLLQCRNAWNYSPSQSRRNAIAISWGHRCQGLKQALPNRTFPQILRAARLSAQPMWSAK